MDMPYFTIAKQTEIYKDMLKISSFGLSFKPNCNNVKIAKNKPQACGESSKEREK